MELPVWQIKRTGFNTLQFVDQTAKDSAPYKFETTNRGLVTPDYDAGRIETTYSDIFRGRLEECLREGQRLMVVDLGGGAQSLAAREIQQQYPQVMALNLDLFADSKLGLKADIRAIPLQSETTDIVLLVNVLQHYFAHGLPEGIKSDGERIVDEMIRIAKPSARIFVKTNDLLWFDHQPRSLVVDEVINIDTRIYRKIQ